MATSSYYPHVIKSLQKITLNHTCLRVKDPKVSVEFYTKKFGMKLLKQHKFPEYKFDLYFLGFDTNENKSKLKNSKGEIDVFQSSGILELTHNYGTENDPTFKVNNGNVEPNRGFGHVCFSCCDIVKTCDYLENEQKVTFRKKLSDGRQKDIAFVLDPDGYWIELVQYGSRNGVQFSDEGYKLNHTMIRVKDSKKSVQFYQNVLGMDLVDVSEHANGKFTTYFLAYGKNEDNGNNRWKREGILELTHNWGTENEPDFHYHNGNDKPQGYGHICISCKDPAELCNEIDSKYGDHIKWGVKYNQGKMKNLAFIKDPDNYSIEIVPYGLTL
ncbi:lactoylglutathione lyase GLO1 SCDLUD_001202 [Saccharomycodes ludwigii]|uniref:lactoylglutathione lyase GLO1 n=1 Tax=Saccharomycodes ludwigii TaxID=36035 RepID=UPI001E897BCD|nr:hypothetical protein SCDLUD_001202 [Saccharomycodes ludwigii]KAH3903560.1 hypothetical protein SCDLUD_001202 [Saccharomycodes ludwigii]